MKKYAYGYINNFFNPKTMQAKYLEEFEKYLDYYWGLIASLDWDSHTKEKKYTGKINNIKKKTITEKYREKGFLCTETKIREREVFDAVPLYGIVENNIFKDIITDKEFEILGNYKTISVPSIVTNSDIKKNITVHIDEVSSQQMISDLKALNDEDVHRYIMSLNRIEDLMIMNYNEYFRCKEKEIQDNINEELAIEEFIENYKTRINNKK